MTERPKVTSNGGNRIYWGSALDTHLYRGGAALLRTNSDIQSDSDFGARIGGSAQTLMGARGPGSQAGFQLGPGGDTNLYRASAGVLDTDGGFNIHGVGGLANLSGLGLSFNGLGAAGSLRAVEVGAVDSGGTGYRMLRVIN